MNESYPKLDPVRGALIRTQMTCSVGQRMLCDNAECMNHLRIVIGDELRFANGMALPTDLKLDFDRNAPVNLCRACKSAALSFGSVADKLWRTL